MELSKRLYAVASLVTEGASVADIGTDHGYIPIYLAENNLSQKIIAMDVNKGPLERAMIHIKANHLEHLIETRLSDGFAALEKGEVDTIIAAGMGGGLVIKILTDHPEITDSIKCFILQPQSEISKVREYLHNHGFYIMEEDMVEEDGKYYPMMKVVHWKDRDCNLLEESYDDAEFMYGKYLLEHAHPVLKEFLNRELVLKTEITENLKQKAGENAKKRILELEEEQEKIKQVLVKYFA